MKEKKYTLISIAAVAIFLIIWQICAAMNPGGMLPTPVAVVKAFFLKFTDKNPDGATMLVHLAASLKVALSGYLIGLLVGIPLGICMAWYKKFDWFARPLFDLIRLDTADDYSVRNRSAVKIYGYLYLILYRLRHQFLFRYQADGKRPSVGWPDLRGQQRDTAFQDRNSHRASYDHDRDESGAWDFLGRIDRGGAPGIHKRPGLYDPAEPGTYAG